MVATVLHVCAVGWCQHFLLEPSGAQHPGVTGPWDISVSSTPCLNKSDSNWLCLPLHDPACCVVATRGAGVVGSNEFMLP